MWSCPFLTQRGHSAVEAETFDQFIGTTKGKLLEAIAETERHARLYVGIRSPIPSDTGFLPTYNRAIAINHFTLPPTGVGRRQMKVATKGMVGLAALIASGLTIAQFIPALPAATEQNFFQTNTTDDDFDALRQRARAALQTLIEKQQFNERQQSGAATERML